MATWPYTIIYNRLGQPWLDTLILKSFAINGKPAKTCFFDRYLRFTMVMQHDKGCNKAVDMNTLYSKMVDIYYILQRGIS